MKNNPSMPTALTSGWNSDGPSIAAPPKTTAYSEIALGSCSFGTSDATIAPRVGMSNASITPVTAAIANRCHSCITSVAMSTAVTKTCQREQEASKSKQLQTVHSVRNDTSPH